METGRGKKAKKAGWHLTLGVKDAIFAGIGLVGLLMMSFALGALAGRGDIYRAAYSWGLLTPDGAKVAQWMPPPGPPAVAPAGTPGTATSTTVAAAVTLALTGMENRTKLWASTAATAETGREAALVDVPMGVSAWLSTWLFTR